MSRIRGKDTKPELLLREALWANGLRYRLKSDLPGRPDIVFAGRGVVIFVDGCFWHGCPDHYQAPSANREFWEEKISKTIKRDKKVTRQLVEGNWRVIRFWEHEINEKLSECVAQVAKALA